MSENLCRVAKQSLISLILVLIENLNQLTFQVNHYFVNLNENQIKNIHK